LAVAGFGILPYMAAVAVSGVAVAQPITGCGTLVVIWYGQRRLGERFGAGAWLGAVMLMTLPALVTFSRVSPPTRVVGRAFELAPAIWWLAALAAIAVVFALSSRRFPLLMVVAVVALYSMFPLALQLATGLVTVDGGPSLRAPADLLKTLRGEPDLWLAAGLLLASAAANGTGYYLAQLGLQRAPATRFNPLVNAGVMIAGSVLGLILFGQRVGRPLLYGMGMVLAMGGVALLAAAPRDRGR